MAHFFVYFFGELECVGLCLAYLKSMIFEGCPHVDSNPKFCWNMRARYQLPIHPPNPKMVLGLLDPDPGTLKVFVSYHIMEI
jgi:hypothetical protein